MNKLNVFKKMVDVPNTILSVFFSVLQIYIYTTSGFIGCAKNAISPSGVAIMNALVFNMFIPVYSTLEISRMASLSNARKYWPVALIVLISFGIRMGLSFLLSRILKIDKKVSDVYSLIISFPALGSLTLVLGISLCYPGCPLYGDPACVEVPGLLMVLYLIFSLVVFFIGYLIHTISMKKGRTIMDQLKFVWYRYINLKGAEDLIPIFYITKLISWDKSLGENISNKFVSQYRLKVDEDYNYTLEQQKSPVDDHDNNNLQKLNQNDQQIEKNDFPKSTNLPLNSYDKSIIMPTDLMNDNKSIILKYYQLIKSTIIYEIDNEKRLSDSKKENLKLNVKTFMDPVFEMIIQNNVPYFSAVKSLSFNNQDIELLNNVWSDYQNKMKDKGLDLELTVPLISLNLTNVIHKVANPPLLACTYGLLIGISGLRDTLFSPNHYLRNLFYPISFTSIPVVTMIFTIVGYNLVKSPRSDKSFQITRFQFIMTFIMCFIVFPAIGLGLTAFLKYVIGGIFEESRVFLFVLYLPFCTPVAPTYIIVVNLAEKYYYSEFTYILARQLMFMVISLTILIVVYFLVI